MRNKMDQQNMYRRALSAQVSQMSVNVNVPVQFLFYYHCEIKQNFGDSFASQNSGYT